MRKKVEFWSNWFGNGGKPWSRPVGTVQLWAGWIVLIALLVIMKLYL
jgi:hypothetical protein